MVKFTVYTEQKRGSNRVEEKKNNGEEEPVIYYDDLQSPEFGVILLQQPEDWFVW